MSLQLSLDKIKDEDVRTALQLIKEAMDSSALERGNWVFLELVVTAAQTNLKVSHGLKFQPTDIIQTSLKGQGSLTWNYSQFDKTFVVLSTTGPCTVRAYIGRHKERSDA